MTTQRFLFISVVGLVGLAGCSSDSQPGVTSGGGGGGGADGSTTSSGGSSTGGSMTGSGGSTGAKPTYEEVKGWIEAYKAANPGNGGKAWDVIPPAAAIGVKTAAEIAADPAAQQLRSICGKDQLPVIPLIAWEYGGSDHQWINPQASALVYCVYIPVNPGTPNWTFDTATSTTTADVYVLFPDQNPCKNEAGADQVMKCLGDPTNIEIIVDTININDGTDVGLSLSTTPTEVMLIQPSGTKVHMYSAT